MAVDNNALIQALIDGGITPAASRIIANALANAATPQFSRSRDIADATPQDQLRLIDGDTRKYLLTNLDYSSEAPYQSRLQAKPGQYAGGPVDHPYKDSQPVAPVPPLSQNAVAGGDYIAVDNSVRDNAQVATVSLKLGNKSGPHLRINPATKSAEAVPLIFNSPQGLVTGSVSNDATAINVELVVRALSTLGVTLSDGTVANVLGWIDQSAATPTRWVVPSGAIMPFAALLSSPQGWLLCDGTGYSTTTYAALYTAIGYSYGGSGATFQVPDLRGYFIRGCGTNADGTASGSLGAKQGQATKLPSTPFTGGTDTAGSHTHQIPVTNNIGSPDTYSYEAGPDSGGFVNINTFASGNHAHLVTITSGGDTETRPKNIAMHYYIKT